MNPFKFAASARRNISDAFGDSLASFTRVALTPGLYTHRSIRRKRWKKTRRRRTVRSYSGTPGAFSLLNRFVA